MRKFFVIIILFMFSFNNNSYSSYDKIFYDFSINSVEGKKINLKKYENKAVLLINTASFCGFTKQYDDMQKLWNLYKKKGLIVIAVPSSSFNQEKSSNKEVKEFCEVNFNINFLITEIYEVKGENAHEIYKWAKKNYGKGAIPKWNFHKILINKEGKVEETYNSFTNPMSKKILLKIDEILDRKT